MRHLPLKNAIWLLLAVAPAFGAVTASPTSIHLYSRLGAATPWYATAVVPETTITVSGTGSWSISLGGSLSSACGFAYGYCINAVASATVATNNCSGSVVTGSGAGSFVLCARGLGAQQISIGDHTGTVTVGSTTINITWTVLANNAYDAFVYRPGYPSGCTNSDAGYPHADTCSITNERPTSNSFATPAVGGTYIDPQFGYVVNRITPIGWLNQYGTVTAFSATSKYVLASSTTGVVSVFPRAGAGSATYSGLSGPALDKSAWDTANDEKLWYMEGSAIKHRILDTATVTTAADYTSSSGSRPAMTGINMGGSADITGDGWWVFTNGGDTELCAVNLNGLTTSNQESKTYCADITSLGLSLLDFPAITQVDSETGKRYILVMGEPNAHVYSVGASSLTYEYPLGTVTDPHSGVGQDEHGRQFLFYHWDDVYGIKSYLATVQISKGADMFQPAEVGGGLRLLYPIDFGAGTGTTDGHFGCSFSAVVCVHSPFGNSGGVTAHIVTAVTAGTPCTLTVPSHGLTTGDSVLIGGALGITSINGVATSTVTNSNTITLAAACAGTYTASSANLVKNVSTASDSPNRQELFIVRPGHEVRRLAIHRSKIYDDGDPTNLLGYFWQPRASISRDGCYVAFETNWGVPEQGSVAAVETGLCATSGKIIYKDTTLADTSAILNYQVPSGEAAATITVSDSPSLGSPVISAGDAKTSASRQYVATGLTANTDYYFRIFSGLYSYTGQFHTAATLSGSARLFVKSGNGSTILHGSSSSLGSSSSSPLDVTVSRGLYYYNAGGGVQAVVVK